MEEGYFYRSFGLKKKETIIINFMLTNLTTEMKLKYSLENTTYETWHEKIQKVLIPYYQKYFYKSSITRLMNSIKLTRNKYYNLTKICPKMIEKEPLANLMYVAIITQLSKLDKDREIEDYIGSKKSSDINWIQHLKRKYMMIKLGSSLECSYFNISKSTNIIQNMKIKDKNCMFIWRVTQTEQIQFTFRIKERTKKGIYSLCIKSPKNTAEITHNDRELNFPS